MPSNRFNARLPPINIPTTASLQHTFIYGDLAADPQNQPLAAIHASPSATLLLTPNMASSPTRDRMATSPISPSSAFPPYASANHRLAATHFLFTASSSSSFPNPRHLHKNRFFLYVVPPPSPLENSDTHGVPANFTLINMASPPTDIIASHSPHNDSENQLGRRQKHHIHKHGILADKTCNQRRHDGKRCVTSRLLDNKTGMDMWVARTLSTLLTMQLPASK